MVVQENDGKWTNIEGTITGRVKLSREEEGVESASHLDRITEDQDAPGTAKRKLQLDGLREESNNYLKEIGLPTSTPSAPEESEMEEECQANNTRNGEHSTEQGRWRELSEEEDTRIRTTPDNSGERNTTTALRRKEDQQLQEELVKSLNRLEQQLRHTEEIDVYAKRTLERSSAEMEERMRQIEEAIQREDDNLTELEKKENCRRWESNWPSSGRRKGQQDKPESAQQRKSGRMIRAPRRYGTEEDLPATVMEEPELQDPAPETPETSETPEAQENEDSPAEERQPDKTQEGRAPPSEEQSDPCPAPPEVLPEASGGARGDDRLGQPEERTSQTAISPQQEIRWRVGVEQALDALRREVEQIPEPPQAARTQERADTPIPPEAEIPSTINRAEWEQILAGWDSIDRGVENIVPEDIRGGPASRTRARTRQQERSNRREPESS
ncbi:hypothetical protein Q7C36_003688 [Tachysurus vachellii]|uniref:Uncharacterized protein n=1 Tax=Tachysurus vachellii TaxID=175792 RepID=A0AA88NW39_TACVA|nr:hypothetical protein Q7C36_003688 [Tachysurus vachellii]